MYVIPLSFRIYLPYSLQNDSDWLLGFSFNLLFGDASFRPRNGYRNRVGSMAPAMHINLD